MQPFMDRTMLTPSAVFSLLMALPMVWSLIREPSEAAVPTKPIIYEPPADTFSADGVLEFTCRARGSPKPLITWYDALTGQKVIDRVPSSGTTTGIHVNQHYGRLMVSNPIRNKIYSFYCNASNTAGWTKSHPPVKGGLAYLETMFRHSPIDKTVHQGDRVVLECIPPVGVPEPKVAWFRHRTLVVAQHGFPQASNSTPGGLSHMQLIEPGNLQISTTSLTDSGEYMCVAANTAGQQHSDPIRLTVKPRARFIETPKGVRVRKGESAKFKCRVEGNQMVKWSRGPGEGLIDPSRIELADGYLLLKNVQLSDAGSYVCTAPGSIAADAILTVETPPTFSRTPDDLTVMVGQTARFHCVTTGYPQPSIYWELPDKTPIFPSDDSTGQGMLPSRFHLHPDGTFEVRNVQESDAGKYQCTAHSSIDRVHSSALLHVVPRPKFAPNGNPEVISSGLSHGGAPLITHTHFSYESYPLAPIIGLPPVNQTRLVGDLVILDCELGATRHPISSTNNLQSITTNFSPKQGSDWSVTWYRATLATEGIKEQLDFSRFVHEQRYSLLPGGSLQIFNAQLIDTGSYTCSAQTWVEPNPNAVEQSTILLQSNWTAQLNVVPVGSVVHPDQGRENPLSPPRDLRVTNVTESTITLAWEPSNWLEPVSNAVGPTDEGNPDGRGVITYWVEFYRPDRAVEGWRTVEKNWPANTVQIGGLQPNTAYYFLIRPRWRFGRVGWASAPLGPIFTRPTQLTSSGQSSINFFSDKELLQAVRNVEISRVYLYPISPRQMRVSWTVHERPAVLQAITGYTIYYRKINLMQCVPTNLQLVDERALPNELGDSYCSLRPIPDRASVDLYRELQTIQRMRQQLASSSMETRLQFDVKATYPLHASNPIQTGPVVYEGSGLIRELDPFQCYEVSVKPHSSDTVFGKTEGRESVAHTALTFESFPSLSPERVAAQWVGPADVSLSWSPPPASHWNGVLRGYTIYVYDELAREHQTFNISSTEQNTIIKGLTGSNAYMIQMAASTCKGVGLRSKPLRMDPSFRGQIGLGVGWGFDPDTGMPVSESTGKLSADESSEGTGSGRLIHKPWFIGTMISSLLLWFALIGLITFCCRRQPYVFRKTTGGVLIANTSSHCGTNTGSGMNGLNGTLTDGVGTTHANGNTTGVGRYGKEKNCLLQMEPLIQKPAPIKTTESTEPDGSATNAAYAPQNPFLTSPESSVATTYGVYSLTHNNTDLLRTQWANRPNDLQKTSNRGAPMGYPLPDESGIPYATTNNSLIGHGNPMRTDSLPPNVQTNPILFHPTGHLVNYPLNMCPPSSTPAYLTYQPGMVPLSQSISEFPSPDASRDQGYAGAAVPAGTTVAMTTGLPPIAPVAQLGHNGARLSPPSVIESVGSAASVAPYATASIIQNSMMAERGRVSTDNGFRPCLNTMSSVALPNGMATENPGQVDKSSYSSGDSNRSYSNNSEASRANMTAQRENVLIYGRGDAYMNGGFPAQETRGRASTPGKSPNPLLPSRTLSSNPSKSESNASTSTRLSGGLSAADRSSLWPNSPSSMGKMTALDTGELSTSGYQPTHEEDVYSLADDSGIPPPPASPPPPAPIRAVGGGGGEKKHFDPMDSYPLTCTAMRTSEDANQSIYDMNAETSEDEALIAGSRLPSSSYTGSQQPTRFNGSSECPGGRCSKRGKPGEDGATTRSGYCVSRPPEESQNTTYAQVY